jgi:hypothetical protein
LSEQDVLAPLNTNPNGCWNWWSYGGDNLYQAGRADQRDLVGGAAGDRTG